MIYTDWIKGAVLHRMSVKRVAAGAVTPGIISEVRVCQVDNVVVLTAEDTFGQYETEFFDSMVDAKERGQELLGVKLLDEM